MPAPTDVADLRIWLKADAGITSSAGSVSTWANQASAGGSAGQTNAAKQPVLTTSAINGLPAVTFDGVDDWLQGSATFRGQWNAIPGQTTFAVYRDTRPAGAGTTALFSQLLFASVANAETTSRQQLAVVQATAATVKQAVRCGGRRIDTDTGTFLNGATDTAPRNTWTVASGTSDFGVAAKVWSDGTLDGTLTPFLTTGSTPANSALGAGVASNGLGTGEWLQGDIAEILMYSRPLTDSERATVHSYLQDRYAITVSDYVSGGSGLAAPTGLAGSPASSTSVLLTWNAVSGATAYQVERDGTIVNANVVGTSWTDTGLTPGATYTYRIRSVG